MRGDSGRRGLAGTVAVVVMSAVGLTGTGAIAAEPVHVPAQVDGFRIEAASTYTWDPPARAVHVAVDMTITNQSPDQAVAGGVRQFYLPDYGVPVLAEAVGLRAVKSDGTTLPVTVESTETPRFSFAVVDLRPDVYHPSSQTFRLTYDLPPPPPRSEAFTRLNEAYATFPALALGDPGLASVEVVVPKEFDVELVGNEMRETERDGRQVFTAAAIDAPDEWGVFVSARDDSKLITRVVDVGDAEVNVLGWPDDAEWADFAAAQVEDGVPVLEEIIGLEWPARATLDVVETSSPYLYGYSGWYVRNDSLIEIGDKLEQQVILHELAHLWFNDSLFRGRWINEAFANQVATLAIAELGDDPPEPEAIDPDDPGRVKLNDWSDPDLQAEVSADQERYGYNASWAVLDAIVDEIGPERLSDVIRAAEAGQVAYRGPDDPEELVRIFDWEELLDLLEEIGGSETAAALFERHVVSESETADFEARAQARSSYAALLEAGDGWAAPTSVRLAMTDWRFDAAEDLMDTATEVLGTKTELLEVVAGLEVDDELALQGRFEQATDLTELVEEADHALAAAEVLRVAEDARADGAGPLGAVGLLFSSVDDDLAEAQDAFDDGDYARVETAAAEVDSTMEGAGMAGVLRLLALLAVVLVLVGGWTGLRRRRRARAEVVPADALEPDGAERVGGPADGRGEGGV